MMRALKATALALFAVAAVAAMALIAAWPLGATPSAAPAGPRGQADAAGQRSQKGDTAGQGGASPSNGAPAAVPVTATMPATAGDQPGIGRDPDPGSPDPAPPSTSLRAAVADAARLGIRQSVMVLNRADGTVVDQVDPTRPLPSMSLVKLFIAVDLLDRSGGPDNLDAGTAETLWRMITVSDDNAASRLWIDGGDGAIVQRIAPRFGLAGVAPPAKPGLWGDTTVTAGDLAHFLRAALIDASAGPWLTHAMESAADTGADGFDQNFGMNTVTGAGSKQGWGCCLRGVRSLDSVGFTGDRIVVALSSASPGVSDAAMRSALTSTVRAALRG